VLHQHACRTREPECATIADRSVKTRMPITNKLLRPFRSWLKRDDSARAGEEWETALTGAVIDAVALMEDWQVPSVSQWQAMFDAVPDAVALLDKDGEVVYCNRAMMDFHKRQSDELVGHDCHERVHSSSETTEECPIARMQESRQRETAIIQINGQRFLASADPLFDEDGNLTGAVHILTDITKRGQISEALQEGSD